MEWGAYIPCEWKLTLIDHSAIEETVALIQGALKKIDEEGVMEVEACEDFLYIMFNPSRQILFILYIICSVPVLCKRSI